MGDETPRESIEDSVAEFIEHQNKVNVMNTKIMEEQRMKQKETHEMLTKLMEYM